MSNQFTEAFDYITGGKEGKLEKFLRRLSLFVLLVGVPAGFILLGWWLRGFYL
jgi:hypothetical protein